MVLHGLHLLDEAKSEEEFKFDAGGAEEVSGEGVDGSARLGLGGWGWWGRLELLLADSGWSGSGRKGEG